MGLFHHHHHHDHAPEPLTSREQLSALKNVRLTADIPDKAKREEIERSLEYGLEAAPSIHDRRISLFSRGHQPDFAGIKTFMKLPYVEDIRNVKNYDAAFVGAPFDMGTGYRPGARFGPEGVRRISALMDGFSSDMGVDLVEEVKLCDAGDIFCIPSNLEKSFDQIDLAVQHLHKNGVFPIICGGDHSIGYPDVRGTAPYIDGKVGIIHFDRHIDMLEYDMDERMHTTPWFHATNIPNAPASNLVQVGIGGWIGNRGGIKVARERDTTVISMYDVDEWGIDAVVDLALECAWKDAKAVFLSFDIDVCDPAYAPGTGTPEPGGLLSREALRAVRRVAKEGLCGMEVVEIAPAYDVADITSLLGARVINDVIGTLVQNGKLGTRPSRDELDRRKRDEIGRAEAQRGTGGPGG